MKLTKKEERERMLFVLETMDNLKIEHPETPQDQNGFPFMLKYPNITPLLLFSSQTNGMKAVYCGIHFGLINVELKKEQLTDEEYILAEVNKQIVENQKK